MDLDKIREEIDKTDKKIIELISRRCRFVEEVIQYKVKNNIKRHHTKREEEQVKRIREIAKSYNLEENFAEKILRELINHSHKLQKKYLE